MAEPDEIKGLVERLKARMGGVIPEPSLLREVAAALTLSDEARVRAEASFDALQQLVNAAKGDPWTAFRDFAARAQASEALIRELVEGLKGIADGDYRIVSGSPGPLFSAGWAECGKAIAARARDLILKAEKHG